MDRFGGRVKSVIVVSMALCSLVAVALVAGVSISALSSPRFSSLQGVLSNTGMVELNGSLPYIPEGAVQLTADLNLAQNITVFLGFNTVNNGLLDQFLQGVSSPGSPIYGHYISHATFMQWFEPNESTYDSVAAYYESHGLRVLPSNDRLYMGLEGSMLNIESAFNTTFALYNTSLGIYYFNIQPIYVPSSFAGVVSSVIGFTDYPYFMPQLLVNPASNLSVSQALNDINNGFGGAASPQPPYTPYALYKAYDELSLLDAGYQGQFETIAVTDAYGDPTASTDMATYDALYNVSAPASFQVLYPYGTPTVEGILTQYENAILTLWEVESALDFELAHAFAPQANIVSVVSPDADYTLIQSLVYVITNHLADVVSNSWGAPEPEVGPFITYMHPFFKMAAAEGITVLAASGDQGSAGYDPNVPRSILWPSDDPYVTAVGGTTIFMNGTVSTVQNPLNGPPPVTEVFNPVAMVNETAWDGYTGGGYSVVFPRPFWQHGEGLPTSGPYADARGVPDVSANAMFGGNDFVFNGLTAGSFLFGGTSFASPTWAGIVATIDSYVDFVQGIQLGFINPALYEIFNSPVYNQSFYDVIYGYNGPNGYFNAGPGWSPVTGLGSPKTAFLASELAEYTFQAGAVGDARTTNNTGVSAAITTVVPERTLGESVNMFYVKETLSDGTVLMAGYAVSNQFPTATVFYAVIPSIASFGTSFVDYLGAGSAGANGSVNTYTIVETTPGIWTIEFNGHPIASYSSSATSSGKYPAEFVGAAQGVTSSYNVLGPAGFSHMVYYASGKPVAVPSEKGFELTNIYSSYAPPYYFPNPYGVAYYTTTSTLYVGSGEPSNNNTVLFGTFESVPPTTVFLKKPQYVTLYAQHVASIAKAGGTSFPLTTVFPEGQSDFDSFYLVPVLGVSSWTFTLNQSTLDSLYFSQTNLSYVHFFISLESLTSTQTVGLVPVTVTVSVTAGPTLLGEASQTNNLSPTGGVVEYNLSFLPQAYTIPANTYITMKISWYTVQAAGESVSYAVVLHSGQNYPISLSLPLYNPVDVSPPVVTEAGSLVYISSRIVSPFGAYDLRNVVAQAVNITKYYEVIITPTYTVSGYTYTWVINTTTIPPGNYTFTVYAYDLQGDYNYATTSFTTQTTSTVSVHVPPPPPPPPRPPKPKPVGPP